MGYTNIDYSKDADWHQILFEYDDQLRHRELVLKLTQKKGVITRKDVVDLLHITAPQAYRLLKKMVEAEELIATGTTSGAKYKANM